MRYCCHHVFLLWGGVGPTVSDLSGVTAVHANYSREKRGLAATSFTYEATQRAASTRNCPFISCPGVHVNKHHVLSVSKQRESRADPLWLKGNTKMKSTNSDTVYSLFCGIKSKQEVLNFQSCN